MTHSIDPATLKRAAAELLEIEDAGFGQHLDREIEAETGGYEGELRQRELNQNWRLSLPGNEVDRFAERLAGLLDCPHEQARSVALDVLGYSERRAITLKVLAQVAREVRLHQARQRARRSA
jgi:hypothetical protein